MVAGYKGRLDDRFVYAWGHVVYFVGLLLYVVYQVGATRAGRGMRRRVDGGRPAGW